MAIILIAAILLAFAGGYIVGAALTAWQYDGPDEDWYGEDDI